VNVKRALITTTIHTGLRLGRWAQQLDRGDVIIIAGDQRSPHTELRELVGWLETEYCVRSIYLDPETQEQRFPRTSRAIPWNCVQRRNLALLEALTHGPDYVITVDDDNVPNDNAWVRHVDGIMAGTDDVTITVRSEQSGWWDPGRLNRPHSVFRGFPIEWRHRLTGSQEWDFKRDSLIDDRHPIGVFQSMILGDPDCDAVERIVRDPRVTACLGNVICERSTWAPFNSQATVWHKDIAPLMFMWPFVGRYDDIWAAYTARAIMDPLGRYVRYGYPLVHQDRNAHSVLTDLRMELLGMEHTLDVARALRAESAHVTVDERPIDALAAMYAVIRSLRFLPPELNVALDAWLADLAEVGVK
jgi:hypothetical protein